MASPMAYRTIKCFEKNHDGILEREPRICEGVAVFEFEFWKTII